MYQHIKVPADGQKITVNADFSLNVPDNPIIPYIEGDGTGVDISPVMIKVVDAAVAKAYGGKRKISWMEIFAGEKSTKVYGPDVWLPEETLKVLRDYVVSIKGPLTTPVGGGFRSVNVRLREEFQLYANLRPAHTLVPGGRFDDIDLILVRENLEGLYVAFEHYIPIGDDPHAVAISSGVNTRAGSTRIVRFAFEYALRNGRKKVTVVHKANVLKALTGIFLDAGHAVAKDYAGRVEMDDRIVDACAMQLVLNPWQFDVIVTTNLFGDILSDEMAGLVGGLGFAPGANIGQDVAIFEAVHGSAPDIAGKGVANPVAVLLAAGLMLDHVGRQDLAGRLRTGFDLAINRDGVRTGDMGGRDGTRRFAEAIAAHVRGPVAA